MQRWNAAFVLLIGCAGAPAAGPVAPTTVSASGAVESFMEAVADSNLSGMASLWGTYGGPASRTGQPTDYERRIAVMHAYLRNESHRVLPFRDSGGSKEEVQVEIRRALCTWVVPFTVIKLSDGTWLVNQVDLTRAGNPARKCEPGGAPDTTSAE